VKTGKTIQELAAELARQAESKRDFNAPTGRLNMEIEKKEVAGLQRTAVTMAVPLANAAVEHFPLSDYAHGQIASETKIPKTYYDRMMIDAPELLTQNINHWFHAEPKRRLVRTLDGRVRAFLSERYRPLDNADLAEAALPVLIQRGCVIVSSEITEKRLYIKATLPELQAEVKGSRRKGDIVQAGVVFSNSEIGSGRLLVEDFFDLLYCTNGLITTSTFAKFHLGRAHGEEAVREILTSEAKRANDKAFWLTVRDVVANAFDEESFKATVARFDASTRKMIEGNPESAIDAVQEVYKLTDETRGNILKHLIEGGDLSQWGLSNAITRSAEDESDYDDATELERLGGKIIELKPEDWKYIAEAA
jgi:hypothetical protein